MKDLWLEDHPRFEEIWNLYAPDDRMSNFGYDPEVDGLRKFAALFYSQGFQDGLEGLQPGEWK